MGQETLRVSKATLMKIITFHSAIPVFERLGKGMSGNGNADRSEKSFKAGGGSLSRAL
jgi:hypothetical protein